MCDLFLILSTFNRWIGVGVWTRSNSLNSLQLAKAYQPGPTNTQLVVSTALSRAGPIGGITALLPWNLPGLVILTPCGIFLKTLVGDPDNEIRMLVDKIKADFLIPTKAELEIELLQTPMTITYDQAIALFRNMVNQKHPPQMGATQNRVRCNVNKATTGQSGRANRGGFGRGGRGGRRRRRGGRGTPRQTRTDSRTITLTDGTQKEYHVFFYFPRHIFMKMRPEDKETLWREREN